MARTLALLRMVVAGIALAWMAAPSSALVSCGEPPACASADPACNHDRSKLTCTAACQPACSVAVLGTSASLSSNATCSPIHCSAALKFRLSTSSGLDPPPPRS